MTDTAKNGFPGTLTACTMTVTPVTEGAANQGETLAAAAPFFFDLVLAPE